MQNETLRSDTPLSDSLCVKAENGLVERVHVDTDGTMAFQRLQDVEPVLESVKSLKDEGFGCDTRADTRFAGRFPIVVVEGWCARHGYTYADFMRQQDVVRSFLNDPANKPFRVWNGRV